MLDLEEILGLSRITDFPTRKENTLDILFTNRPSSVNRRESISGISDHDAILNVTNITVQRRKPPTILPWKKADLDNISTRATTYSDKFCIDFNESSDIDTMLTIFRDRCSDILSACIPG